MSVTEIKQSIGNWTLQLKKETPQEILDSLTFYGHIVMVPGQVDPAQYGDALLASARYVGVYRGRDAQDSFTLKGSGMAFWLGDEDGKGDVFETPVVLSAATFANSLRALLPPGGAIAEGVLHNIPGTYTGKHQWVTPRQALSYVTDLFGGEWRVNYDGTLDAGLIADLYVTVPRTLLLRKGYGSDLLRTALPGRMAMGLDVEDVTTRVVLLAEGEGSSIATASADAPVNPYKDIHGNPVKAVRLVSESGTESGNAAARAQLQLNRFLNARRSVSLSTNEYDVKGTFVVGDYLDVYDPDNGFVDSSREVYWQGEPINPMALRCVEMTWPVPAGWTVAFRDINGNWIDLSQFYVGENGDTTIVVGELARGLASVGGEAIGVRPNLPSAGDSSIPAAPAFGDFSTGSYQPSDGMWVKAAILATWTQPLNIDGSTITDGDHYEIRYRVGSYMGYQVRWGSLGTYRWGELSGNRWGAPITDAIQSGEWHTAYVGWGQTQFMIQELTPGVEYEFQIRAIDGAVPAHQGPWSASKFVIASVDLFAPSAPAAPVVASSRIAIQVVHTLGKSSGGVFNLEPDLAYLSVHVGGADSFLADDSNMVGKLLANSGMISAQIAAVGTFPVEQTDEIWVRVVAVDTSGNRSNQGPAAPVTANLIDNAHISSLSVSKVTAGLISAAWILGGSIKTSESGARMEMDAFGLRAYNTDGERTVNVGSDGAAELVGTIKTQVDGAGVSIYPGTSPKVVMKPSATDDHEGRMYGYYFSDVNAVQLGVHKSTGQIDGGKVLLMEHGTVLSYQPDGGVEQYLAIDWPYDNMIYGRGKFPYGFFDSDALFYAAKDPTGAGFSGSIMSYAATMTGEVYPVYSITGGATAFSHWISASSNTGFTVSWSGTEAHDVYMWVVRG